MEYDYAVLLEWLHIAVRWLHIITAIAWIGSSFYFIALDLGLRSRRGLQRGVSGEQWQVHGGGFYHISKYLVAPANLPEHLVWFKWESYSTWISGFALLILIYYAGADLYLIDSEILDLTVWQAILLSLSSLIIGWLIYNFLCRSIFGRDTNVLLILLFFFLVFASWFYSSVFSGRAAFLHLGALTATLMTFNVFFIIIPNQRIVVSDLRAGRVPDSQYGIIAKQRSLHNNYLTLPVIFMMMSNHYPLSFATQYNWLIASLIFLMGVTIRHFFNSYHSGSSRPTWTWLVTAILFILAAWLSSFGSRSIDRQTSIITNSDSQFASHRNFSEIHDIIDRRCVMCHSHFPVYGNLLFPAGGVVFDNERSIVRRAREIYLHAGRSRSMPMNNVSRMTYSERMLLVHWYEDSLNSR